MQGGRGGGNPFFGFGDPFGGFGGFGGQRSPLPGFFEGRSPFDDPFFTQPFGGMFESNMFGPNAGPFGPSAFPFGPNANPFVPMQRPTFIEHQAPDPYRARGPTIEELVSDDEEPEGDKEKEENSRKHGRSGKAPYIEEVDEEAEGRQSKQLLSESRHNNLSRMQTHPRSQSFVFQSSSVSYGGNNGTYYTSSRMRRTGSDGVTYEESKEADTATRKASHRISRGIHNKGHTLDRKLNSEGKVDTQQILHNLEHDELHSFEQAWTGTTAGQRLPSWGENFSGRDNTRAICNAQNPQASSHGGRALPSTESSNPTDGFAGIPSSSLQHSGKAKHSDIGDANGPSGWQARD